MVSRRDRAARTSCEASRRPLLGRCRRLRIDRLLPLARPRRPCCRCRCPRLAGLHPSALSCQSPHVLPTAFLPSAAFSALPTAADDQGSMVCRLRCPSAQSGLSILVSSQHLPLPPYPCGQLHTAIATHVDQHTAIAFAVVPPLGDFVMSWCPRFAAEPAKKDAQHAASGLETGCALGGLGSAEGL